MVVILTPVASANTHDEHVPFRVDDNTSNAWEGVDIGADTNDVTERLARMEAFIEILRSLVDQLLHLHEVQNTTEHGESMTDADLQRDAKLQGRCDGGFSDNTSDVCVGAEDDNVRVSDEIEEGKVDREDAQEAIDTADERIDEVDADIDEVGSNFDSPAAINTLGEALAKLAGAEAAFDAKNYTAAADLAEEARLLADDAADLL